MTFCCAIKRDLCWNIIFKQYIYSERCETIVFSWFPYRRIRWIGLLEFPLLGFFFLLVPVWLVKSEKNTNLSYFSDDPSTTCYTTSVVYKRCSSCVYSIHNHISILPFLFRKKRKEKRNSFIVVVIILLQ